MAGPALDDLSVTRPRRERPLSMFCLLACFFRFKPSQATSRMCFVKPCLRAGQSLGGMPGAIVMANFKFFKNEIISGPVPALPAPVHHLYTSSEPYCSRVHVSLRDSNPAYVRTGRRQTPLHAEQLSTHFGNSPSATGRIRAQVRTSTLRAALSPRLAFLVGICEF